MKEGRAPSPGFDSKRYERPNKEWVCGHACEGCPCRIGPSPSGECRATTECFPRLTLKAGETKGTWVCTRPGDWGGPCEAGPLPDGRCCREISRCRPVRSLRARRGLASLAAVAACLGVLLIGLSGSMREPFVNPRPLSRSHSGAEFAHLALNSGGGKGCALCHVEAKANFGNLVMSAVETSQTSLRLDILTGRHPKDFSRMDSSCLKCHEAQAFHHADVAVNMSCPVCHREHQGAAPMAAVDGQRCVACHGDPEQMHAAALLSAGMSPVLFMRGTPPGQIVHAVERPAEGLTEVITSFSVDHPEFRVLREHSPDRNTLKFNHRLHLTGSNIPLVNGRALDCEYCHRPDASNAYMARTSFEQSCRACHALDFDERNPGMKLPHGDAAFVRAYLRSLPVQYADYASRTLGITGRHEIDSFVRRQISSLQSRMRSVDELERTVFLSDGRTEPVAAVGRIGGVARARFEGCALCHEVAWRANAAPLVTPPQAPDRWLPGASFNHAMHATMACSECHAAVSSERTSDVILPTQQSCVRCHSPEGGAAHSCTSCHVYHNRPPVPQAARDLTASLP
jgi:hypothetical protein